MLILIKYQHVDRPDQWQTSITILIHKEGKKQEPNNYRGIYLLNSLSKLFKNSIRKNHKQEIKDRDKGGITRLLL